MRARSAPHTMRGRKALHTMRARAYLQITTRGLDSVCVSRHSRAARHRQRIDRGSARARSRPFSLLCMPSNTETRVLFCIIAADKINSLSLIHINNRVLHCDSIKGSNVPGAGFDPLREVTRLQPYLPPGGRAGPRASQLVRKPALGGELKKSGFA